jgi:hypothetical protein
MANASLQIGNGNWAIKEDNLLSYSKAGTRFLPIPITMTRATLGTRVNPSGLIENVELLGDELVTNGDFATDSDWSKGSNWTISGGSATSDGVNATSNLSQVITSFSGKTFLVEGNASNVSQGFAYVSLGGSDLQIVVNSSGAFKHYVTISSGNSTLFISGRNNFIGSIDNVSVKEVTRDGLARVDYTDGTGSLLVEPQRTNLIPYSEDFSNADWGNARIESPYIADIVSPDGTLNAYTLEISSGETNGGGIYKTGISVSGSNSFSIFAKKKTANYLVIADTGTTSYAVYFDLENGVVGTTYNATGDIQDFGNGWYRCTMKYTLTSSGNAKFIYLSNIDGATSGGVVGGDSIYVFGAQLEEGSYPTSYIKTSGSSVTRNQDEYTKTGISDKINSEEGVLYFKGTLPVADSEAKEINIAAGGIANAVRLQFRGNGNVRFYVYTNNTSSLLISVNSIDYSSILKVAVAYKSGESKIYINGVQEGVTSTATFTFASDLSELNFRNFYGNVNQLQVFKTALSDSELATLTT